MRQQVGIDMRRMVNQTVGNGHGRAEIILCADKCLRQGLELWVSIITSEHGEHHSQAEGSQPEALDEGVELFAVKTDLLKQQSREVFVEPLLLLYAEHELERMLLPLLKFMIEFLVALPHAEETIGNRLIALGKHITPLVSALKVVEQKPVSQSVLHLLG